MVNSETALTRLGQLYAAAVDVAGGRSLARVATIVVNRGSFFTSLAQGKTCSVRNFDKLLAYFTDPTNWPDNELPPAATDILRGLGRLNSEVGCDGYLEMSRIR